MKIKSVKYKAGSILLWKQYGLLKRIWYKLLRKHLPCNKFLLFESNGEYLKLASAKLDEYILEPKKAYSREETKKLNNVAYDIRTVEDLIAIINAIRPNTIENVNVEKVEQLRDVLSKYYKERHLLDEKEYSDYILPVE